MGLPPSNRPGLGEAVAGVLLSFCHREKRQCECSSKILWGYKYLSMLPGLDSYSSDDHFVVTNVARQR
jgi:hypothetical protein